MLRPSGLMQSLIMSAAPVVAASTLVACVPDYSQDELLVHEIELVDSSRSTIEAGEHPAEPQRELLLRVWVGPHEEEGSDERPLLFMSHGLDGHPDKFEALATDLAMEEMVVAALRFPMSNRDAPAGSFWGMADLESQPGDVRFALDFLEDAVADKESPLFRRFDPARLLTLGHSLGGATTMALTRLPRERDPRPVAVILVAPSITAYELGFDEAPLEPAGPPTLLLHELDDPFVSIEQSQEIYGRIKAPRALVGMPGDDHSRLLESQVVPAEPQRATVQDCIGLWMDRWVLDGAAGSVDLLDELSANGHLVMHDLDP